MRRSGAFVAVGLLLAAGLILGYSFWKTERSRAAQVCSGCSRPIHSYSRTVAYVGNRQQLFCCPTCALTERQQTGTTVRVVRVTDYETGSGIAPEGAYLVQDSDMNHCARTAPIVDEARGVYPVRFDRCSPGYLAFAQRTAAERFIQKHGGKLVRFEDVTSAYQ